MVGMPSSRVTAAATTPGTHSSTTEKQPAASSALASFMTRSASLAAVWWCGWRGKRDGFRGPGPVPHDARWAGVKLGRSQACHSNTTSHQSGGASRPTLSACISAAPDCAAGRKPPSTEMACGMRPTWPITATPASTTDRTALTRLLRQVGASGDVEWRVRQQVVGRQGFGAAGVPRSCRQAQGMRLGTAAFLFLCLKQAAVRCLTSCTSRQPAPPQPT